MSDGKLFQIVIIGPASSYEKDGYMPSVEDVNTAIKMAENNKLGILIHIIDENLNYAVRLSKGQPSRVSEFILKDASRIKGYPNKVSCYINPPWEISDVAFKDSDMTTIKNTLYPVIYLSYKDKSSYEIMNSISAYSMENRWFVISSKRVQLTQLVADYISLNQDGPSNYLLPNKVYDLYGGGVLNKYNYSYDLVEIKKQLVMGCIIIDQYLKAGYNTGNNAMDVMGWCLNAETTFIKGICHSYGLMTPVPDKTNHMELRQNSSFRRQLWDLMTRVISSFSINNKLITVEEAMQYGGWYDQRVYMLIRNRIDNIIGNIFQIQDITEEKETIIPLPPLKIQSLEEIFGSLGNITLPKALRPGSAELNVSQVTVHLPRVLEPLAEEDPSVEAF